MKKVISGGSAHVVLLKANGAGRLRERAERQRQSRQLTSGQLYRARAGQCRQGDVMQHRKAHDADPNSGGARHTSPSEAWFSEEIQPSQQPECRSDRGASIRLPNPPVDRRRSRPSTIRRRSRIQQSDDALTDIDPRRTELSRQSTPNDAPMSIPRA